MEIYKKGNFKTLLPERKGTFDNSKKITSSGSHKTTEVSLAHDIVSKYMSSLEIARVRGGNRQIQNCSSLV